MVITEFLVKKYINQDSPNYKNPVTRKKVAYLEVIQGTVINIALFMLKLTIGIMSGSLAIISDAFHTLSDIASSFVIWIGFKWSSKEADADHPFGHGRIEHIAGIIVAVLLAVAGFEFLRESIHRIIVPQKINANIIMLCAIASTVILKEISARLAFNMGTLIDSATLKADAWHHRTDAISSIFVVIILILQNAGIPMMDGIGGVIISLLVIYSGIEVAKESINPLIGTAPTKKDLDEIRKIVLENKDVQGIHDLIIHSYGTTRALSLHIELDEKKNFVYSHDLAEKIEEDIAKKLSFDSITIHTDPVTTDFGEFPELKTDFEKIVSKHNIVKSFHDLRLVSNKKVLVDLCMKDQLCLSDCLKERDSIVEEFQATYPKLQMIAKVEPMFHYNMH